jgi:hypothetical protein
MHDVANASLPVAIGLLSFAAVARAAELAQVADGTKRVAWQYLEPLSTWCLIALAVHTLAVGAAGEAGVGSLALPLGLGVAAVLLRAAGVHRESGAAAPAAPPPAAEPTPAAEPAGAAPARVHDGSLWADPTADEATRRNGLWSRA